MELSIHEAPPSCGRRLIPTLVDEIAQSDPHRPFISIPKSQDLRDGYKDISYSEIAKAVDRCAWWIEKELGRSLISKTLFYIGPTDIRYIVVLLAASKAGHAAFLSSHRNSLSAHLSLLEATQCHTILLPSGGPSITKQILTERPMRVLSMPGLDDLMLEGSGEVAQYPFRGTFDEMRNKTFVVLHTSGSTGIPKPVFVTHGTFAGNDAYQLIPSLGGKPTTLHFIKDKRMFLAFPLFHAANLTFTIGFNVFSGVTCVLPPPGPLTTEVVDLIHTHGNLHGTFLPPSMIVDLFDSPTYVENMVHRMEFVTYVGGVLPTEIGNYISSRTRLMTLFGSTETMLLPLELHPSDEDWQYLSISPFLGHKFRPSRDNLQELVVVRNETLDLLQGVFSTFPNIDEYPMKDLYEQHPTKPGLHIFRARTDDIICLSNAEKLNPVSMETTISAHPAVNAAIVGGHGEFQASLLIEPKEYPITKADKDRLLEDIWSSVVQANRECPAHGRVMKDYVIFTTPEKPLPKASKGSVQRYAALELYEKEFRALYSPPSSVTNGIVTTAKVTTADSCGNLQKSLFETISSNAYLHNLSYSADLFACGLDSIQVPMLVTQINVLLKDFRESASPISNKTIYDYPSIEKLAAFMEESCGLRDEVELRNRTDLPNGVSASAAVSATHQSFEGTLNGISPATPPNAMLRLPPLQFIFNIPQGHTGSFQVNIDLASLLSSRLNMLGKHHEEQYPSLNGGLLA